MAISVPTGGSLTILLETLEDRTVFSITVMNLNDGGPGSLRQAMLDANAAAGADVIDFDVAGAIRLTRSNAEKHLEAFVPTHRLREESVG
jgi:hypothetical protein